MRLWRAIKHLKIWKYWPYLVALAQALNIVRSRVQTRKQKAGNLAQVVRTLVMNRTGHQILLPFADLTEAVNQALEVYADILDGEHAPAPSGPRQEVGPWGVLRYVDWIDRAIRIWTGADTWGVRTTAMASLLYDLVDALSGGLATKHVNVDHALSALDALAAVFERAFDAPPPTPDAPA